MRMEHCKFSSQVTSGWYVAARYNAKYASPTPTPSQLPLHALSAATIGPSSSLQPSTEVTEKCGSSSQKANDAGTPSPQGTPPDGAQKQSSTPWPRS